MKVFDQKLFSAYNCDNKSWSGSVISNRLDPDPDSITKDPKHCKRFKICMATFFLKPEQKYFQLLGFVLAGA
jgi:hypothetical protein